MADEAFVPTLIVRHLCLLTGACRHVIYALHVLQLQVLYLGRPLPCLPRPSPPSYSPPHPATEDFQSCPPSGCLQPACPKMTSGLEIYSVTIQSLCQIFKLCPLPSEPFQPLPFLSSTVSPGATLPLSLCLSSPLCLCLSSSSDLHHEV